MEAGSFATSYIPTTTAAVTRAADVCSITSTLFNNSATAGFLYSWVTPMTTSAASIAIQFDDGTANELHKIGITAAAACSYDMVDGGVSQTAITAGTVTALTFEKLAAAWSLNDMALVSDGGTPATDATGTLPTVTTLRIGGGIAAATPLNGWVKQIMHIPLRKNNAYLQSITT